jgi:hypothetical protein
MIPLRGSRLADLESLGLSSITWAGGVAAGLWLLRSDLPQTFRRKNAQSASIPVKAVSDEAALEP